MVDDEITAQLDRAKDHLYRTFARYPRPGRLDISPLKDRQSIERVLSEKPLRQLQDGEIGPYSDSAMTTAGDPTDYCYFLPRILDLATDEYHAYLGLQPWLIANKLKHGHWETWAAAEQEAILHFFSTAFRASAIRGPNSESWLTGLAILEQDLQPCFAVWHSDSSAESLIQFADSVSTFTNYINELRSDDIACMLDEVSQPIQAIITNWLVHQNTLNLLKTALEVVHEYERWNIEEAIVKVKELGE